jgi:acyl-CoA thioester hydrolase
MPQNPPQHAFSHNIQIIESDIDELGHVNNVVYLRWVQEVAAAHWETAREELKQNYAWVVVRHEIDYHQSAFLEDRIIGYTWVGDHQGAKIERFVQLYKAGSPKPIAESKTTWCLLDAKSMRPRRIDKNILAAY